VSHVLASVIIVTFNNRNYLGECLNSLLRTLPADCEVVCLDNCSIDGSAKFIKEDFPEIKFIQSTSNLGFAGGNNLAAVSAIGKYLVFLNPDTTVDPGWLEVLLTSLEEHSQAGMTTPKILLMHSPGEINTCGNDIHMSGLTLCRGTGLKRDALAIPAQLSAISGAAFAIRRELFEKLGGFDEKFFMYMEDADLSWRARLAGYDCLYMPTSIVYHDYLLRFNADKIFYQERNRYLMLLKNLHWGSLLVLLPVLLLAEVVTWGFVLLIHGHEQSHQKFQAYLWIIRNWNNIQTSRRQVQALRKRSDRQLLRNHTWRLAFEQTGPGAITTLSRIVFGPLFWILKVLTRVTIWW
jgi:GT2 family glycosyltransferase